MKKTLLFILLFIGLRSVSQTDTVRLSAPFDSVLLSGTTVSDWIKKNPVASNSGHESQDASFENGKLTTTYKYSIVYKAGYKISFASTDENFKDQRKLNAISMTSPCKVIVNETILLNKSSKQELTKVFGKPLKQNQAKNYNKEIFWYDLYLHQTKCRGIFVLSAQGILESIILCRSDMEISDPILYIISNN